jgi:FkbM family methyltransferase
VNFYGQFDPPVDRFLYERYFAGRQRPGVAIECGAFDGVTECSCKVFEESLGWTCINVEPYPPAFDKLVANRPHATNLNVALSDTTGTAEFTAVIHPVFGADCNNGSLRHTDQHRQHLDGIGCTYRQYRVPTTTYAELVTKQQLSSVDLFVLDVEGNEREVLEGMRNAPPVLLPAIICIEHGHLGVDALKPMLATLGYAFDTTSFVNSFYVRNDVAAVFFALRSADPALLWRTIELERDLSGCRADKIVADAEVVRLTNSRSWRYTAPLRRLKLLVDRLRIRAHQREPDRQDG